MSYLRGALVEFIPTPLPIPIPNVIIFQYNPESMTHSWTQPQAAQNQSGSPGGDPMAVRGAPGETFAFTLAMDATDSIADNAIGAKLAVVSGVYSRLAALEMLLQPSNSTLSDGLIGLVSAAMSAASHSDHSRTVPNSRLPVVLFIWGAGRIVPVRLTGLTVTEQRYDQYLNPIHAEAQVTLTVLSKDDINGARGDKLAPIATAAVSYTNGLRQALAVANLVNAVDGVIGMLPL